MIRLVCIVTSIVAAFALCSSAQATLIYADNFDGVGGPLNGAAVDVGGQNWQAGPAFLDDGSVDTVVAGSPSGNAAFLPLSPVGGYVYTATATIDNSYGDWIAFGFLPASPPGGDWTATDFSVRHSNNGAYAWVLDRTSAGNDQEAFNGPSTSNNALGGDLFSPNNLLVSIVLDTTAATWTAEYILNGNSQGVFNLDAGAVTDIGGVGFSRDRNSAAGTGGMIAGFTLTQVPEPCTLALLGLGMVLLRRRFA